MKSIILTDEVKSNLPNFKKFGNIDIENLSNYIKEYVSCNTGTQITIGSDSQQKKNYTHYAVAIMFYNPYMRAGSHIIYNKFRSKKIRDIYTRLYQEIELSLAVADYVHDILESINFQKSYYRYNPNTAQKYSDMMESYIPSDTEKYFKLVDIHLDFNPVSGLGYKNKSNIIHDVGKGMCEGYGYRTYTKPYSICSSSVADLLCK